MSLARFGGGRFTIGRGNGPRTAPRGSGGTRAGAEVDASVDGVVVAAVTAVAGDELGVGSAPGATALAVELSLDEAAAPAVWVEVSFAPRAKSRPPPTSAAVPKTIAATTIL